MPDLTTPTLQQAIGRVADKMEACADELNALDNAIGDGDIGITMATGGRALREVSCGLPDDVGMALLKCAQAFTGKRGSSFGTLFATGLMAAAKQAKGRTAVPWAEVSSLVGSAVDKMSQRGRSQLGEKTVLDALDAIRDALDEISDPAAMLAAAQRAVGDALDDFRDKPCKQGRARIFGDKTIGIDDPGMVVIMRVVEGMQLRPA